jgi:hypothetical protein
MCQWHLRREVFIECREGGVEATDVCVPLAGALSFPDHLALSGAHGPLHQIAKMADDLQRRATARCQTCVREAGGHVTQYLFRAIGERRHRVAEQGAFTV